MHQHVILEQSTHQTVIDTSLFIEKKTTKFHNVITRDDLIHDFTTVTICVKLGAIHEKLTLSWNLVKFRCFLWISTNLVLFLNTFYVPVVGNNNLLPNCSNQILIHHQLHICSHHLLGESYAEFVYFHICNFNCTLVTRGWQTFKNITCKYFITLHRHETSEKGPWSFREI